MRPIETIDMETINIEINGIMCQAAIRVEVYPDEGLSIDDLENEEPFRSRLLRDLERGDASVVCVDVTATIDGITGVDTLGAVVAYNHDDITETVKANDMVANAVTDAVNNLTNDATRLAKYVK